ncbi:hypothetical protein C5Y93_23700 [Blastopirellula marina]|uniref:C2H2-type domain-containing protein n=1 Tax=Blastopirellula marina TaxID=124 RepID=A0A2S8GGS1_9BACT|nr:hypothetical protein C5Y93_23700 [Blastopirellula marina]
MQILSMVKREHPPAWYRCHQCQAVVASIRPISEHVHCDHCGQELDEDDEIALVHPLERRPPSQN